MNSFLKTSIVVASIAFGAVPFLSASPAAAGGFSLETGLALLERSGVMHTHPRMQMLMGDEGPSYGKLEGGMMIVLNPYRNGPTFVHGKNNCDQIKHQIAAAEKRLGQMNARLDQMLADYRVKEKVSTKDDTYYSGLSIESLDNQIKDLEQVLASLRGKLKKCETAKWF